VPAAKANDARLVAGARRLWVDAEHAERLADFLRLQLEKAAVTARSIAEFPAEDDEAVLVLLLSRVSRVVDDLGCALGMMGAAA
jgi:hypothetical protein